MVADVVGLYPSIPHEVALRALRQALGKRDSYQGLCLKQIISNLATKQKNNKLLLLLLLFLLFSSKKGFFFFFYFLFFSMRVFFHGH